MPKLSKQEIKDLEAEMLPYALSNDRAQAEEWREDNSYLVVCMGILSYRVLSAHPNKDAAKGSLKWWRDKVKRGLPIHPLTSHPDPHDLDVWTQDGLDKLTKAIQDSYRY